MSTVALKFSKEQTATLIWLKILDNFKEGKYKNSSFAEKYLALALDEPDLKKYNFQENVDFWIGKGLFKEVKYNNQYSIELTEKGKTLFELREFKKLFRQLVREITIYKFESTLKRIFERLKMIITHVDNKLMEYNDILIALASNNPYIVNLINTLALFL